MSNRRYPAYTQPSWFTGKQTTCCECRVSIAPEAQFCQVRTQYSYMRGEDEIEDFCVVCAGRVAGFTPPTPKPPKHERRRKAWTEQLAAIERKILDREQELVRLNKSRLDLIDRLAALQPEEVPQ